MTGDRGQVYYLLITYTLYHKIPRHSPLFIRTLATNHPSLVTHMQYLAIFIGGGLGSLCRYGISRISIQHFEHFPIHTLLANICSSAILGALIALFLVKYTTTPNEVKLFFATGFCGGFSTFSTFSLETFLLLQNGQTLLALSYALISVIACVATIFFVYNLIT